MRRKVKCEKKNIQQFNQINSNSNKTFSALLAKLLIERKKIFENPLTTYLG
jgi:hypothetical protein